MAVHAPRILISRMSAVGDTILTLPVACALRQAFPRAHLAWVVEEKSAGVVQGHECLDEVITLQRGWFTSPRGILEARQKLRAGRFEVGIDCQGTTKSSLACWLSKAKQRIGYRGKYASELSPFFNNQLVAPKSTHLADRSRELLSPLGIIDPPVEWKYPLAPEATRRAVAYAQSNDLQNGFAVINPGASWNSKLWTMPHFGAVARYLGETHGLPTVVVWGSDQEQAWAKEIVAAGAGHCRMAPRTSLAELAALLRVARLFVGSDTGPLHLAVAVGTPTIGLHGVTLPQDSGPYGPPHIALQVRYDGGTRRQRRQADNSAMKLITPKMVAAACDTLLQGTQHVVDDAA